MALFGFADPYAMFDVTPVENLFIQEYMLRADGEFVKVYLYGLMQCYHPVESASLKTMAKDLAMEESRVENAFTYWERMGLVRRISDNPIKYAYTNLKQAQLMQARDDDGLYRYADFNKALQAQFGADRLLHPQDFYHVYDWIEGLRLPEEAVLMLVSGQIKVRGKKFLFKSLDRTAREWSEAGVTTIQDAENMLRENTEHFIGLKEVYKKLGKRHAISEPDEALYDKWARVWGFDQETILAACEETTKGTPTTAYLNGILERMHQEGLRSREALRGDLRRDADVKELLRALGMRGTSPTADSLTLLDGFLNAGFERETIALAAARVARKGGKLDALQKTLNIWKEAGALTVEAANAYLAQVDAGRGAPNQPRGGRPNQALNYPQHEYTRDELQKLFEVI